MKVHSIAATGNVPQQVCVTAKFLNFFLHGHRLTMHCILRRDPRAPAHTRSLAIVLQSLFQIFKYCSIQVRQTTQQIRGFPDEH